jgi:hypothetical protein
MERLGTFFSWMRRAMPSRWPFCRRRRRQ